MRSKNKMQIYETSEKERVLKEVFKLIMLLKVLVDDLVFNQP